ncbi:MAG: acyl-CoA/acyl-ACP dehydrogenase [Lachnospiraceae bacterium]|jgi:alkylation response protein AidB-like acyl-CoA dehydrogenase|nr:acyl-CoA/acyl-ACP dehydrogenase [Lachnospiraceae bacterium]MCI8959625.1 acyl-CoA/acyl-ACP dehydrogenase [Lachnospiraceae bacterium]
MKLTEKEFQDYLLQIRALAEGPFDEMQKEIEVTNTFPKEFYDLAIKNDLYRFALPEKYGGFGLSERQILMVQEEFSRGPGGMRMHLHHAADLDWRILDDFGSEELKAQYMDKFQDKTLYANFALTEETGGTGADIHTTAIKDGDYYVINGEKTLISHTDCSDFTYLIVSTDPNSDKDSRLSAFFVDVNTPGYEIVPMPHMMGCRGAGHAGLKFTNMRVHKKYLLGQEGMGLEIAMHSLAVSRAHIAVSNLGMAQRMLEMTIKRTHDRITFGKPLCKRQAIQQTIADMGTQIHALRLMIWDFAKDYDDGKPIDMKAAMCKLHSIDTVRVVSDAMLEIFGGIGYFEDCAYGPVERLYRDCRAMWLEEGPRTVQRLTAFRGLDKIGGRIEYGQY